MFRDSRAAHLHRKQSPCVDFFARAKPIHEARIWADAIVEKKLWTNGVGLSHLQVRIYTSMKLKVVLVLATYMKPARQILLS